MPFILFPVIFTPVLLAVSRYWMPRSLPLTLIMVVLWISVVCGSVAYGLLRVRKYKRDHRFSA